MKWKISSKTEEKERFYGSLRVIPKDKRTSDFLRSITPTKRVIKQGLIFEYFPDGKVAVRTIYETIQEMVKEINRRSK